MDKRSFRENLLFFGAVGLVMASALLWLGVNRESEGPAETSAAGDGSEMAPEPGSEEEAPAGAPAETDGERPARGFEEGNDRPETPQSPGEKTPAAELRRPFAYGRDLEVTIRELTCRPADEGPGSASGGPAREDFWRDPGTNYTLYGDRLGPGRTDDRPAGDEGGRNASQSCRLIMEGRNTGDDRYLPDGCGLNFERAVSLVGWQGEYRPVPMQRICTKNIIDFPNGAVDREILHFAVGAGDEIGEILIQNPSGGETRSIPVAERGAGPGS